VEVDEVSINCIT